MWYGGGARPHDNSAALIVADIQGNAINTLYSLVVERVTALHIHRIGLELRKRRSVYALVLAGDGS